MQKKIIALAVAGLVSGAALAQSNVTLYGRADLGYVYSKSDFRKFQGVDSGNGIGSGASRIGLQGEEALGGGLKAIFKFEWGVNADEGGGPTGARYTYVGLTGNFGTVTAGRIGTPSDLYMGGTATQGINGVEPINFYRNALDSVIHGTRWNNAVGYASPNFSGLEFMGLYSFGEKVSSSKRADGWYDCSTNTTTQVTTCYEGADTADAGQLGLGVRYANGPVYVAAIYQARADDDSVKPWGNGNAGYGAKGWGLGGAYDFKVVKLYANYFQTKGNDGGRANRGSDKRTAWSLGVGVPVSSAGTVTAEYAQFKDNLVSAGKSKGFDVGYRHNLSKRTWLYANVSRIDNDRDVNVGYTKTGVAGEKQTNFVAGVVHLF
jgi:predicted porin